MRLQARATPYSSVVGGGLQLTDDNGHARFLVVFCGTNAGITEEEDRALSEQIAALINGDGITVPARGTDVQA